MCHASRGVLRSLLALMMASYFRLVAEDQLRLAFWPPSFSLSCQYWYRYSIMAHGHTFQVRHTGLKCRPQHMEQARNKSGNRATNGLNGSEQEQSRFCHRWYWAARTSLFQSLFLLITHQARGEIHLTQVEKLSLSHTHTRTETKFCYLSFEWCAILSSD